MQEQGTAVEIINLPPIDRVAIALASSNTEKHLRELAAASAGIVAVVDPAGREEAHRAAMQMRTARTTIQKTGKAAREDAQAFSSAVISEEKRLIQIILPEEDRLLNLRDNWDNEQARIKAEAARKEAERKAGLQAKVDSIRNLPLGMEGESAAEIANEIEALRQFVPGPEFMEYDEAAKEAAAAAIEAMTVLHARQVAKEAEAAALAAQKAEQERIAAEQEAERQRLAKIAEEQAAALKAEQEKLAAEQKAAAEALEAERAKIQKEREELAAFQAKLQAQAEADQRRKEELAKPATIEQTVVNLPPAEPEPEQPASSGITDLMPPAEAPAPAAVPTLRLGNICTKLGFTVTADFLLSLGFAHSGTDKAAKLYHEHEYNHIARALMRHIEGTLVAEVAA
jgi:chemotaxis protein histidine kinase CheA